MDEFGKDLRCECKLVTGSDELVEQSPRICVTRMRRELCRHKKRRVNAVNHQASPPEDRPRWSVPGTDRRPVAGVIANSVAAAQRSAVSLLPAYHPASSPLTSIPVAHCGTSPWQIASEKSSCSSRAVSHFCVRTIISCPIGRKRSAQHMGTAHLEVKHFS